MKHFFVIALCLAGCSKKNENATAAGTTLLEWDISQSERVSIRTAEKIGGEWVVNQWAKKAVLLSFRLTDSVPRDGGATFPGIGGAPSSSCSCWA